MSIHCLELGWIGKYAFLGPRDLPQQGFCTPRPSRLPSGNLLGLGVQNPCFGKSLDPRGAYFPIHPSSRQCIITRFLFINTCVQDILILVLGSSSGLPLRCAWLPSRICHHFLFQNWQHCTATIASQSYILAGFTHPLSRSGSAFQESHFPKSPFVFAIGVVLARLFNFLLLVLIIEASLQFSDISRSGLAFQETHSRLPEFWQNIFWTWLVSCECANEVWMSFLYARRLACRNYESVIDHTYTKFTPKLK